MEIDQKTKDIMKNCPKTPDFGVLEDIKICRYPALDTNIGYPTTFAAFLRECYDSKDATEFYRAADEIDRKALKQKTPGYSLSGVFEPVRGNGNLKKHSGLICADIDHTDASTEEVMTMLRRINCVLFASRSISGSGIFAVIRVAYPDRHGEQFEAMYDWFARRGIMLDRKCKDVCRLRAISYDAGAFLRPGAVAFTGLKAPGVPVPSPRRPPRQYDNPDKDKTRKDVEKACADIISRGAVMASDYNEWIAVAASLNTTFGEEGREYFHDVSSTDPRYSYEETDKKWDNCKKLGSYGIAVFFKAYYNAI